MSVLEPNLKDEMEYLKNVITFENLNFLYT